jgi:hypothetical protein
MKKMADVQMDSVSAERVLDTPNLNRKRIWIASTKGMSMPCFDVFPRALRVVKANPAAFIKMAERNTIHNIDF